MSRTRTYLLVPALVLAFAVTPAQAATIHVDIANCPGPGSGTVRDPYCLIQTAIIAAVTGDEVVVAPGTYNEAIFFNCDDITIGQKGVYGHWATYLRMPTEQSPSRSAGQLQPGLRRSRPPSAGQKPRRHGPVKGTRPSEPAAQGNR